MHGATLRRLATPLVGVLLLAGCASGAGAARTKRSQTAATKAATPRPTQPPRSRPAARCTWHQLRMNYYGGGAGAGNDFGLIQLRNTAPEPCRLTGRIGLVGLDLDGTEDTVSLIYQVPNGLILTPRAARIATGHDIPGATTIATIEIAAEYRDQPDGIPTGLCTKRVIPARWRVTLVTGSATVANIDSNDPYTEFRRLLTCAGELDSPASIVSR